MLPGSPDQTAPAEALPGREEIVTLLGEGDSFPQPADLRAKLGCPLSLMAQRHRPEKARP
jgi:hypothetical protein